MYSVTLITHTQYLCTTTITVDRWSSEEHYTANRTPDYTRSSIVGSDMRLNYLLNPPDERRTATTDPKLSDPRQNNAPGNMQ